MVMMAQAGKVFLLVFMLCCLVCTFGNPHENALNLPQLLLPYAASDLQPTTFQLRALRGCFKWSSTKPQVASVNPINDGCNRSYSEIDNENACSQSALVIVKMKTPGEDTTVVLAEEEGSGTTLRCDVFVDTIDHISIATTARELLIGESPEVFEVYAYDKEGNMFSALGSTTFEWNVTPLPHVERVDQRSVLKMLWFHDSVYETSSEIYGLESQQLRGSSVLIEGISTGDAMVSAKFSHPEYKDVESKVKVTVLDNVILIPPNEYILVYQTAIYSALRLRRGKQKVIALPSEQYSLKVVDESIGEMNETDVSVRGLSIGVTKVQLIDKNTANLSSARLPTATLNVVNPANIGFAINPGKLWILETGREYYMHVRLFDSENNRIKIDENVLFDSTLSSEYFDVKVNTVNGSYFYVKPIKVGNTVLSAILKGVKFGDDVKASTQIIFGDQNIEIYDPVSVTPENILFPWEPSLSGTQNYQHQLVASGGSGNYVWSNIDSTIAVVNKKGIVSAGSAVGEATIKVFDAKNTNHFGQAKVTVLPPTEIAFIDGQVEALVGSHLKLSLIAVAYLDKDGKEKSYFKDCRKMVLKLSFSDGSIFKAVTSEAEVHGEGCTSIVVEGINPGFTTLTATYTYADVTLQSSIVIAAYKPVTVIDPFEFTTVTLGSKKRIVAEAGPLPWILDSSQYHHIMVAEKVNWVGIKQVATSDDVGVVGRSEHVFDVTCNHLGEQTLTISVFNKPTLKNKFPAESSTTTRYVCAPPAAMKLVPLITLTEIDGTKRTLESCKDEHSRIPVLNDRDLTLNLLIYDANGNLFDDASSLNIEWSTDDLSAAQFLTKSTRSVSYAADVSSKSNSGVQLFEVLQVHAKQLAVTVSASITSYKNVADKHGIQPPISTHLPMVTVPAPSISPVSLQIFTHELNRLSLAVAGGTQQFVLKGSGYTDLTYSPPDIKVTPKSEGEEVVRLFDACLDSDKPAEAHLLLSDIYAVKLATPDKVEIGQTIEARCIASDSGGNVLALSPDAVKITNLQLKMSIAIVDVEKEVLVQVTQKSFILSGKSVGITSLTCNAMQSSGNEIASKAADVQVFSPLELDPKYILLIVGSIYQIHSRGGPRPHSTTVYSSANETVANVDKLGLVTANVIGTTIVTGQAKGDIVYSQDQTIVEVIQLKGFKISLKSRNLITDSEVGVLSVGITDEGPFTFATSPPYLKFHWTSSNHKVAVVESFHNKAGVTITSDQDFRAVLRVISPGQVTIKLKVEIVSNDFHQVSEFAKLDDEIEIRVFEKLQLIYPKSGSLLLPSHGIGKLLSNKDQVVSVSYELLPSCPGIVKDSVISVSDNGQITASSSSGTANVLLTAHEEFGFNQTILVQIEVKPVASITLVSNSPFVVSGLLHPSFPIGSTIIFGVALHDGVARKFDVSTIPLLHTTTRSDVVQVIPNAEDMTFSIRAASVGETILKVWDKENPSIADYVRVSISEGIIPSKATITLGETICFRAAVSSGNGFWTSSGNLVSINQQSGVAVGLSLGSTIIHFEDKNYGTDTELTVVSPSKVPIIEEDDSSIISNNGKNRLFRVTVERSLGSCANAVLTDAAPLSCIASWDSGQEVAVADVFKVEAAYINGVPACSLTTLALSVDQEKLLTVGKRSIVLNAKLTDGNTGEEFVSLPLNIQFIPKFFLDADSIIFNAQETSKIVQVLGTAADVEALAISCDSSALTITKTAEHIEISTGTEHTSDIHTSITISSPLTKHSIQLPVTIIGTPVVAVEVPQCPVESKEQEVISWWSVLIGDSSFWMIAYTIILATIIVILLMYHLIMKRRQVTPVLVPPPAYSPYLTGKPPASPYFNAPPYSSPYKTPGSPNSRTNMPPSTLFSVSQ